MKQIIVVGPARSFIFYEFDAKAMSRNGLK